MLGNAATKDGGSRRSRPRGAAADRPIREVPVRAIDRGGALTTTDGAIVRVLELTPQSALAATSGLGEELLDGVAQLLGRLAPGEALQWYAESAPGAAEQAAMVVVRTPPEGAARLARAGAARGPLGSAHRQALDRSLARTERISHQLAVLGLRPRLLDGPGMSRLLLRRLRGIATPGGERRVEVVGALDERADAQRAIAAGGRVMDLLRGVAVDFRDDRRVAVGTQLEQAIAVNSVPDGGVRDWLAPLFASEQRYAASIHVRAREDGLLDLGAYMSLCESGAVPDAIRLATAVDDTVGAALSANGVRVDRGEFTQRALWPATLPLGIDPRHVSHRVDVRVAASALPLFSDRCGSPAGVAFARGPHGRVEQLDPWDLAHRHSGVLIAGGGARERAQTALALLARSADRGTAVVVLDADGELAGACAQLGDAVVAIDAQAERELLPLAGRAAALLAGAVDPLAAAPDGDAEPGLGMLVVTGAERLLAQPGGGGWLRRTLARARLDGCCVVLAGVELAPFDAAGLLGLLPIRVLLSHPPAAATALGARFALAPAETRALVRDGAASGEAAAALWLNGDRGRALVRVLDPPAAGTGGGAAAAVSAEEAAWSA